MHVCTFDGRTCSGDPCRGCWGRSSAPELQTCGNWKGAAVEWASLFKTREGIRRLVSGRTAFSLIDRSPLYSIIQGPHLWGAAVKVVRAPIYSRLDVTRARSYVCVMKKGLVPDRRSFNLHVNGAFRLQKFRGLSQHRM